MDHRPTHCLNCQLEIRGKYCHGCGQKASTHRLSMKHFLQHDLLHGIWHIDKGILFTLKHCLFNPGNVARDYIKGQRAGHFNLFTLLVLLSGLLLLTLDMKVIETQNILINDRDGTALLSFLSKYIKWFLLMIVPLLALASRWIYKAFKYNFSEHLVLNAFLASGVLVILLAFRPFYLIPNSSLVVLAIEILAILAYLAFAYRQLGKNQYSPARNFFYSILTLLAFLYNIVALVVVISTIYLLVHPG